MIDFIVYNKKFEAVSFLSNDTEKGIHYENDALSTSIDTGVYVLELTIKKTADLKHLVAGHHLSTYTNQGKLLFLTITDISDDAYEKRIFAEDTSINVMNSMVDSIQKPTAPEQIGYYINHTLEGSGIKIGSVQSDQALLLEFQSSQRRLARLGEIAQAFGTEMSFRVDFDPGEPPEYTIDFLKVRTEDDLGFRLSTEDFLNGISRRINTTNIATRLAPRGVDLTSQHEQAKKDEAEGKAPANGPVKPKDTRDDLIEKVIEIAMAQRGKPYVWGGNGPNNFDCSGFINYAFKQGGYTNWPSFRCTTNSYWDKPQYPFERVKTPQRGDLVMMDTGYTYPGDANHVGLYLGDGKMIHAGKPVQVANLANFTVLGYVRVASPKALSTTGRTSNGGMYPYTPTKPSVSQINYGYAAPGYESHRGTDIVYLDNSSEVYAVDAGTVVESLTGCYVGNKTCGGGWGNYIKIKHSNGYSTLYAHFERLLVSKGQTVQGGQQIGVMGNTGRSTGKHLHLELWDPNGNRVDPEKYLNFSGYRQLFKK